MKICPTCGNRLNDEAMFCANCGNPVPATVETATQAGGFNAAAAKTSGINKKVLIGIIAAVAVVVVVVVLCTTVFSSNAAAKRTAKACLKAQNSRNASKMVKLEYPKPVLEWYEDEEDVDEDEFIEEEESSFENMDDYFGDDWKIKDIKIKKVKDLKEDDFDKLQDAFDELFDMKISEAKVVKMKYKIKGEDKSQTTNGGIIVYKYKGKWYMLGGIMDALVDYYGDEFFDGFDKYFEP